MMASDTDPRGTVSRRALLAQGLAIGGAAALDLGMGRGPRTRWPRLAGRAEVRRHAGCREEVDPLTLDPHTSSKFSALQGTRGSDESLTGFDEKTAVVPGLAEKWEVTNDGKTYTFHLRPTT